MEECYSETAQTLRCDVPGFERSGSSKPTMLWNRQGLICPAAFDLAGRTTIAGVMQTVDQTSRRTLNTKQRVGLS